jgi:CMP-N-acetylneuraminic acid synthetase
LFFRKFYGWQNSEEIILLPPTSPLRKTATLKKAIFEWERAKKAGFEQAITVTATKSDFWHFQNNKICRVRDSLTGSPVARNTHDRENFYEENGFAYFSKIKPLMESKSLISGNLFMIEVPKSESFDIDTQEDLALIRNFKAGK